jgi:hypothetical protein
MNLSGAQREDDERQSDQQLAPVSGATGRDDLTDDQGQVKDDNLDPEERAVAQCTC